MWAINQLLIETVARLILRLTEKQPEQVFKYNNIAKKLYIKKIIYFSYLFFKLRSILRGPSADFFITEPP